MRKTIRQIHHWIAVISGLAILAWTVSAVAIVMPRPSLRGVSGPEHLVDYRAARVSPAEAMLIAEDHGATPTGRVELHALGRRPAYRVNGTPHALLIDANSGESFRVDSALAVAIARNGMPREIRVGSVTPVSSGGAPTAYRVTFDDAYGSWALVNTRQGSVRRGDRRLDLYQWVVGWHNFSVLERYGVPHGAITASLWIFLITSLAAIGSGLWMTFPLPGVARFRRRRAAARTGV